MSATGLRIGTVGSFPVGSQQVGVMGPAPTPDPAGNFIEIVRLHWRVLHPVTGAVIVDPLPHAHQSWFKVVYPQPGMPLDTAIGDFEIPLIPPSDEAHYAWAKPYYDKLAEWQRVEAYLIEHEGAQPTGDPVFSGVIDKLPQDMHSYTIAGKDSLYWLTKKHTHRADSFSGRTDQLFTYALKGYAKNFGDDFTGNLTGYTNDGGWTQVSDDGWSSIRSGTAGDGLLITTASFNNAQYADCEISAPFHLQLTSSTNAAGEASIAAAAADVNNLVLGQVLVRFVNPNRWEVDLAIWQKASGIYHNKAYVKSQILSTTADYRAFVQLFGSQTNATTYTWRLLVDGVDVNCVWAQSVLSGSPSGSIGIRSADGTAFVTGSLTGLAFLNKTSLFQPGNVGIGARNVNQPIPITKLSDLVNLALTTEGWGILKYPKAGINNDVLDFNANPAGDISSLVRFEEGETLEEAGAEPNAEPPGTSIVAAGNPNSAGQGLVKWYALSAMDTYGLVEDTVSVPSAIDALSLRKQSHSILSNRSKPHKAKRLRVHRHHRHNHHNSTGHSSTTGLRWREGHFVMLHVPRNGIIDTKMQVVGFTMKEGDKSMDVLGDQYPQHLDAVPAIKRMKSDLAQMALRNVDVSGKDLNTGAVYDRRLVLPQNPWKMRVWLNNGSVVNPTTLPFNTVTYDTTNNFNTSTFSYTVTVPGWYQLNAVAIAQTPASAQNWALQLSVQTASTIIQGPVSSATSGTLGTTIGAGLNDLYYFNAGDQVSITAAYSIAPIGVGAQGGNWNFGNVQSFGEYWSMQLVSG